MRGHSRVVAVRVIDLLERAAIGASLLCLIHCAGLPLLLATLPAVAQLVPIPEQVHVWLLAGTVPAAMAALLFGYRAHRSTQVIACGSLGIALLCAAIALDGASEAPFTIAGSIALACAHLGNWRLRHARHDHG